MPRKSSPGIYDISSKSWIIAYKTLQYSTESRLPVVSDLQGHYWRDPCQSMIEAV